MIRLNRKFTAVLALAMLPLAACAQEGETGEPTEQGSQEVSAQPGAEAAPSAKKRGKKGRHGKRGKHGKRGHRGPAPKLMRAALELEDLTAEQKTKLEGLRQAAHPEGKCGKACEGGAEFKKSIAEAIKKGTVSEADFAAKKTAMKARMTERRAAQSKLLGDLHAALTPEQRKAVVAKLEARQLEKAERRAERGDRKGKGRKGFGRRGGGDQMLKHMTRGLELTDAQQTQVDALVEKIKADRPTPEAMESFRGEMKKRHAALLTAFATDTFDVSKLESGPPTKLFERHGKNHGQHLADLVKILDEKQRATLAERFEKGMSRRHRGLEKGRHGGKRGPGRDRAEEPSEEQELDIDAELDAIEEELEEDFEEEAAE